MTINGWYTFCEVVLLVYMGERLKTLRTEMGLTQTQVAQRIGVNVATISAYESGVRSPSHKTLIKLAALYHVTTDYLLGLSAIGELDVNGLSESEVLALRQLIDAIRNNKG